MTDIRRLSFTLPNGASFTAEGTEDQIAQQLQTFRDMLADSPPPVPQAKPLTKPGDAAGSVAAIDGDLPFDRLFTQDDYYGVALSAKPKTDSVDSDGVLAILYGFAVLKKETSVTAMRLQRAAEKSGLDTPRLQRTVAKHASFITESGKGKGKRYGLNNPGMTKAKEILAGILG